ncbi:MAG: hypothetical protein VR71_22175 [Roseovarius sp. BRH_c41]|uniref:hypothetical protein n=1 Tax=Roseovarius sp. BRH_c41 TaxID=1629709 RepID=UPI0005F20592|nr:hypothetical protein [Roseovarius sp. BRH_c41]KJS40695.1 MAG: hypothetical protein VR71_22175 [Roseovarius sp. BRH_c41]
MTQKWLVALLVTLSASQAFAQAVRVRSGEHDGFSRLVLDMPQRTEVSSQSRVNGISISFPGYQAEIDVSQVFDRLTQGRIEAVDADNGNGQLDLTFGCTCEAKIFWYSNSMLVVDIADVKGLDAPLRDQESKGVRARQIPKTAPPLGPQPISPSTTMAVGQIEVGNVLSDMLKLVTPDQAEVDLPTVSSTLLAGVARAAGQGLLQPADEPREMGPQSVASSPPIPDSRPNKSVELDGGKATILSPYAFRSNLMAQSSIDQAREGKVRPDYGQDLKKACLPDNLLDVAAWGKNAPFQEQIGELNRTLSQEFDTFDAQAVLRLARLYVYFGFGREASQLAVLAEPASEETQVLLELAAVIDHPETAHAASRLQHDIGCHGFGALWGALASDIIPKHQLLDHRSILSAFTALPRHLRQHLGPRLALKLLKAKHRETSDMILRSMRDPDQFASPERDLAAAELAIADGKHEEAQTALEASVEQNAQHSAAALLALIDQKVLKGEVVPYDSAQLAGAFYHEHRGSALGQELGRGYLLALAASEAFPEAFSEFHRVAADLSPESLSATYHDLLRLLSRHAEDFDFLRYAISGITEPVDEIPMDLALEMAERVLNLGFAEEALELLSAAKTISPVPRYRILQAEAALVQGQPHRAEAELLGLSDPEANQLRARAKSMLGDHVSALRYLEATENASTIEHTAWLAEDWARLLHSDDPVTEKLAHAMTDMAPNIDLSILARDQQLIEQSADIRGALNDLLKQTDLIDVP